jgi:hypothetical protein
MILVADKHGKLHFIEASTGHTVLSCQAQHLSSSAYTTSATFDVVENRPLLAVGGSDGSVVVHKLTLYRDGHPVSGRRKPIPDPDFQEGDKGNITACHTVCYITQWSNPTKPRLMNANDLNPNPPPR